MIFVTVTNCKRKLFFIVLSVFLVIGIYFCLSAIAPTGNLEDDVLKTPLKVQKEVEINP